MGSLWTSRKLLILLIIVTKLEHCGTRGNALSWFKSYLSDSRQFFSINGSSSTLMRTTYGFQQGSVLGPLLFRIYFNELPIVKTNLAKMVNKELKLVKRWLDVNRLSLNISKTNYFIFHSSIKIPEGTSIRTGRKHLAKAKYVKFLGPLLDEYLSWKLHLSELTKKLARTCGIFCTSEAFSLSMLDSSL